MRLAHLALISALGLAIAPLAAQAYVAPATGANVGGTANIIDVAVHCGPHAHYVPGHRNHDGHYVKGVCVRDKHH